MTPVSRSLRRRLAAAPVPSPRLTALVRRMAFLASLMALSLGSSSLVAQEIDDAFFESRIRPVLVERCYECHNSATRAEGDLALDWRQGLLDGGSNGAAIEPGNAEGSLLWQALRFDGELRMPEGGPQLDRAVVEDFRRWIDAGAPDPRDAPPAADEIAAITSWEAIRDRRMTWWSFRPPVAHPAPNVASDISPIGSIDAHLKVELDRLGLPMAPRADRRTILRRLAYVLTGLPPTVEELARFETGSDDAWIASGYGGAIDHYLASPAFAERWARHWMDWFRYADSHGGEGDPAIPNAWRYRDYLIRAIEQSVPLDRMVVEHLAGDLIDDPRIDRSTGANESIQGLGHWRFVQHGYAPVDPTDERIRFTDNQIDVVSKAFLGLTISCARCHDHKFDPVSQRDYYAWYGIFAAARPALVPIDDHLEPAETIERLREGKRAIRSGLAEAWRRAIPAAIAKLEAGGDGWNERIAGASSADHPLEAWRRAAGLAAAEQGQAIEAAARDEIAFRSSAEQWRSIDYPLRWSFTGPDAAATTSDWYRHGRGLDAGPQPAGAFRVESTGDRIVSAIHGPGETTFDVSARRGALLASPTFTVDFDELWVAVSGRDGARIRFVVQNYPRVIGLLYMGTNPQSDEPTWVRWDMRYWKGEEVHIEIATEGDLAVGAGNEASRSWFGITEVVGRNAGQPEPRLIRSGLAGALGDAVIEPPASPATQELSPVARAYAAALGRSIDRWENGELDASGTAFLDYFVRERLLPTSLDEVPELRATVEQWRGLEASLPVVHRTPGIMQERPSDRPLLVRGDPRTPGEMVPRAFLEAFDATPFAADSPGRSELARAIVDDNPLFARVMANRLWHHVFGRGLVASCDNFGRLGDEPTHPELLDELALRLSGADPYDDGTVEAWSLKRMVRELVSTEAFRAASQHPDPRAAELDPDGRWRSRWSVRRLEAEAIRDAMLAVTGSLEPTRFGPPVGGDAPRRSVYVRVQRNALDPLLTAFDAPTPFSTEGVRPATNVPAQSLMLLNDPLVRRWGTNWADRLLNDPALSNDAARLDRMFELGFGRRPTESERDRALALLATFAAERGALQQERERSAATLVDLDRRIAQLEGVARNRIGADRPARVVPESLRPTWHWTFDDPESLGSGALPTRLEGEARIVEGALAVDGRGHAITDPIDRPLSARTVEAWVQLDDLDQQGGGVVSLETTNGERFDAIVIGEQESRRWLAGSNFFERTESFGGPAEEEAVRRPVHLAFVYAADGTITAYRDGTPYGRPIRKGPLLEHPAGAARFVFGLRHSPSGGNRLLRGRIHEAALFDRALTADEVRERTAFGPAGIVPLERLLEAMSDDERQERERWLVERRAVRKRQAELDFRSEGAPAGPRADWADLALTLLNLKEFVYLD